MVEAGRRVHTGGGGMRECHVEAGEGATGHECYRWWRQCAHVVEAGCEKKPGLQREHSVAGDLPSSWGGPHRGPCILEGSSFNEVPPA